MRRLTAAFAVAVLGLGPAVAQAQSTWGPRPSAAKGAETPLAACPIDEDGGPLVNGSFEDGIDGWVPDCGFCSWEALEAGETSAGAGEFLAPAATDGSRTLVSDAFFPDVCRLTQSVDVTASARFLTADVGYVYRDYDGDASDCRASFLVETPEGDPIGVLFEADGDDNRGLAPRGVLDLSAYEGQTVILVAETVSCFGGPAGILLDNVRLQAVEPIPTLSEWAAILFTFGLMAAAWIGLRRRGLIGRA